MPPPQRANTLRGVAGEPDELNRLISGHSRKDLAAILGVRKAAGDDAADGGADEFLVRWVDGTSGDWVPEAWLEPSPASWGKVLEFRDRELSRLQAESATTIQSTWRRVPRKQYICRYHPETSHTVPGLRLSNLRCPVERGEELCQSIYAHRLFECPWQYAPNSTLSDSLGCWRSSSGFNR